ncbi:MAG: PEP-CTERM sorting domain-containing protein [Leptolyngbya sp. SIOISBB]|nr:PEP-CTERM sorting domain-containing protein [Leptolyngbya sp. SIOISBB]
MTTTKNDYKVSDQWLEDFGVTISTNKNKGIVLFNTDPNYYAPDSAAYDSNARDGSGWLKDFDNDLLTGEYLEYKTDYDGGSSNLGNVLIIQEDNKYYQPDDRAKGGTISFDFEELVSLSSIDLLDIDEFKKNKLVTFQAFGEDGSEIGTWDFDENSAVQLSKSDGDNSLYRFNFDATGVSRLSVIYPGSGAIAALRWEENQAPPTIPEPAAILGLLTVAGLGLRRKQPSQTA